MMSDLIDLRDWRIRWRMAIGAMGALVEVVKVVKEVETEEELSRTES
jgi:hypothetical protein